jgi:hypothetical protein
MKSICKTSLTAGMQEGLVDMVQMWAQRWLRDLDRETLEDTKRNRRANAHRSTLSF